MATWDHGRGNNYGLLDTHTQCGSVCVCENIHMWSARCSIEQVKEIKSKPSLDIFVLPCSHMMWPNCHHISRLWHSWRLEVRTWSSQTWFLSADSLSTDTKNRSESETLRAHIQSLTRVQPLSFLLHLTPVKSGVLSSCCVQVRQVRQVSMCWAVY